MSGFNESHIEEAALGWLVELGYALGHDPDMAPGKFLIPD